MTDAGRGRPADETPGSFRPQLSSAEWRELEQGIALFNAGEFWASHEAWEGIWRRHSEVWRLFLQGLIQMAAAYHQYRRGIHHGALKHLRNARWKLGLFPPHFLGLDTEAMLSGIENTIRDLQSTPADAFLPAVEIEFPKIVFVAMNKNLPQK